VCATPRKVWLTMKPWTIAAGRMTLKLERKAIEGAFAKEIAGLHAKRPGPTAGSVSACGNPQKLRD
jgi:hypothetical protein